MNRGEQVAPRPIIGPDFPTWAPLLYDGSEPLGLRDHSGAFARRMVIIPFHPNENTIRDVPSSVIDNSINT